ncbi:MAG: N-acetylmuramoyl-L-alanine amidase [Ruminococcus sp.]|nr:N-acetylmuramoyl-L-alanine amidase [Ruminococcus sp.]
MRFSFSKGSFCIAAALCLGIGLIYYSKDRIANSVYTDISADTAPVIVLDAGHGGMDGGCSSADGVPEKGINLNIMLSVRDMCRVFGYQTDVTRERDISIHDSGIQGIANQKKSDMDNRLALFNKYPKAVCVSIHQNKFTDPQFSGAQMFYSPTNPESERLAQIMQGKFVENIQPENTREIKLCGKELFLCYFSNNPTIMAECGFLSNPDEAAKLKTEEYQKQVAFTIFEGINEFTSQ